MNVETMTVWNRGDGSISISIWGPDEFKSFNIDLPSGWPEYVQINVITGEQTMMEGTTEPA